MRMQVTDLASVLAIRTGLTSGTTHRETDPSAKVRHHLVQCRRE